MKKCPVRDLTACSRSQSRPGAVTPRESDSPLAPSALSPRLASCLPPHHSLDTMSYHRASDHPRSFRIPPPSPPTHSSDTSSSGWSTPELLEFDLDSPANEPSPLDTIIHSLDERLRTLDRRRSVIKGPRSPRVPAAALSAAPLPSAPACFECVPLLSPSVLSRYRVLT